MAHTQLVSSKACKNGTRSACEQQGMQVGTRMATGWHVLCFFGAKMTAVSACMVGVCSMAGSLGKDDVISPLGRMRGRGRDAQDEVVQGARLL
eukprot:1157049-Pelagomonas_calceolata.AAC.4